MLATLVPRPFHKAGWVSEEKYDGFGILAYKGGARITLLSKNGKNRTQTYATTAAAVAKLADPKPIVDIEHIRREYYEAKEAK
jgi:ATP-dependent DNA ligase